MTKRSREDSENTGETLASTSSLVDTKSSKYIQLDPDTISHPSPVMRCSLPPHQEVLAFTSYEDYEVHYAQVHTNRCLECSKNFPTDHLLSLHIEENHDALFSVKRERGDKMFACFVEGCDRRCSTPHKRRMHLIDKHMFPKEYDFLIVTHGVGGRNSMLQSWKTQKRSTTAADTSEDRENNRRRDHSHQEIDSSRVLVASSSDQCNASTVNGASSSPSADAGIEDLSEAMCALRFVPASVRFGGRGRGRGNGRSGFSRYR
ncbi:hypothetical protein K3495_g2964 [Podosphaera aphanis]|nr:hypothetical protein K3495_g2964 [Podosphaera aphanis]